MLLIVVKPTEDLNKNKNLSKLFKILFLFENLNKKYTLLIFILQHYYCGKTFVF